ncbi:HaeIII family restriction endonuclease [Campylobacter sp. VBCF_05 NA6]|uniref:HaeIII family restriction endonuclease n=1 Tax=unclassified Campylobacter TaxID=2593542 RepID=UPI0022E9CFD2|nr:MULTISPECIES: HaeIII family restriction endonuclease [unclassified Campylobacter]MDA3058246.1 HaeIII family restriction endonuclease [Campylobacter sp. VBCF_04 NA7]MDA3059816.1 HaeIII family restriction endonuclease [Campylobacter sp. VBCF_05 NA6]
MSNKSNNQGRAYEYACIAALENEIKKFGKIVKILQDGNFETIRKTWQLINLDEQKLYMKSATAMCEAIFDREPNILDSDDEIVLSSQSDNAGKNGDVRDILIQRKNISWIIGLSVKHNHFAVKHSRLSKELDFGEKWYKIPCSDKYKQDIKGIFEFLQNKKGLFWKDLKNKDEVVYKPILMAFKNEILKQYEKSKNIPKFLVEYLIGKFDFYKIISVDNKKITQIQSFNLRGTLNKSSNLNKPKIIVPIASLPTRIVNFDFKPNSKNTLELYLDGGWQFSFRIHNASSKIETSLKFDIQIIGHPANLVVVDCIWNNN